MFKALMYLEMPMELLLLSRLLLTLQRTKYAHLVVLTSESAILAALDVAVDDGVVILSLSLGGRSKPFYTDNIALGAYSAMENGILVSCSAGNSGPLSRTLSKVAPRILTVGASTTDRKIIVTAFLGNNEEFDGESLYQPENSPCTYFALFYAGWNASDIFSEYSSSGSMNNSEIPGKIVPMLMSSRQHIYVDGVKVLNYINSTKSTAAAISFKGTIIGDNHAPTVALFSARGPGQASPGILKPDIIGPGINILAAWHQSIENNTNT
ncbi:hypothetical protein ACH5RR_019111 [Cinchona calisaya]|uniref:Peptidase S8/S53 domain-containing protein n=1 Tax=Cinchona calisaya TaxID=153742 RepID=A0ABD2ZNE6_9GENT